MRTFRSPLELEEARQAVLHDSKLSTKQKAAQAERLGDYHSAKHLWKSVVRESKSDSLLQKYAQLRMDFCKTAVIHVWRRPEVQVLI